MTDVGYISDTEVIITAVCINLVYYGAATDKLLD
jgi:hypothetical protein